MGTTPAPAPGGAPPFDEFLAKTPSAPSFDHFLASSGATPPSFDDFLSGNQPDPNRPNAGAQMQREAQRLIPNDLRGYTPQELASPSGQFNYRTGQRYTVGEETASVPILDSPITGTQTIIHGAEQMAQPGGAEKLRGAGKVLTGVADVASPALVGAGVTAPLEAATWFAVSKAAQKSVQAGTQAAGLSPADAQEAGDVASAIPLVYGFGKIAEGKLSDAIDAHNARADELLAQERARGQGIDMGQHIAGDEVPLQGTDGWKVIPDGASKGGRPAYSVVDATGKKLYSGYGGAVQDWLVARGVERTPAAAPASEPAPAVSQQPAAAPGFDQFLQQHPGSEAGSENTNVQPQSESVRANPAPQEPRGTSVFGSPTTIPVPGEKQSYDAQYAVRELADVQPSHNGRSFEANPDYDYQNDRDYRKSGNAERVVRQAQAFQPGYLVSDNPDAVNGPPIVDSRGNVLGGNSRAMTLQRVYSAEENGWRPEAAQSYRDLLASKASSFGLDPAQVQGMRQPVLVRQVSNLEDPQSAITDFNKTGTAAFTGAERAVADARRVSPETLDYLGQQLAAEGDDATLAQMLGGTRGPRIINRLVEDGVITPQEKPQYVDERGTVTPEGKQRIGRLMVGRLFDSPAAYENATPDLRNKLQRIAGPLARTEDDPVWNLTGDVQQAIDMLSDAHSRGVRDLDVLDTQGRLLDEGFGNRPLAIAKTLQQGPRKAAAAFAQYASDAALAKGGATFDFMRPPTPQEAFRVAFAPDAEAPVESYTAVQPVREQGSGTAPRVFEDFLRDEQGTMDVDVLRNRLHEAFTGNKQGEPARNYSGLGAAKSAFVRNLSQMETASPESHTALVRAASWRAQAATLLRAAWPRIVEALGRDTTPDDFRAALVESRLLGIERRWRELAEAAHTIPEAELPEWTLEGPLQVLASMRDENLAQQAAAHVEAKSYGELRHFLSVVFDRAADAVHHLMSRQQFADLAGRPGFRRALATYRSQIEPELAETHAQNEGVFSNALGPLQTYYPLVPLRTADEAAARNGAARGFRKPMNAANQFATGLSSGYDTSMEAFADRVAAAIRANDKAAAIEQLHEAGILHKLKPGERPSEVPFQGRNFEARIVETGPGRIIVEGGKVVRLAAQRAAIAAPFYHEVKPILEADAKLPPNLLQRLLHVISAVSLSGPADAVFHSHNLLGALIANTPYLGTDLASKSIGNTPFTKVFTAIVKLATVDPMDAAAVRDLQAMAKLGLMPEKFGSVTYSKRYAAVTGAKVVKPGLSFAPVLYGPKGIDVRARLIMYRLARAIQPDATPVEIYKFVNQLGNYTEALQGQIERSVKRWGFSPFYTAGSTMLRNGIDAWLGTGSGSGPRGSGGRRIAQMLSGGAIGVVAAWIITYKAVTGKWPWDDPEAKLLKIPAPAGLRNSAVGLALWGHNTSKPGYINFGFASPMVSRGARGLGLQSGVDTALAGGDAVQVAQAMKRDVVNSIAHPVMGPPGRVALMAATGKEAYLVSDREGGSKLLTGLPKNAPRGSELLYAARELNSFYGNVGAATGFGGHDGEQRTVGEQMMKAVLDMSGLASPASNPWGMRNALARERTAHQ